MQAFPSECLYEQVHSYLDIRWVSGGMANLKAANPFLDSDGGDAIACGLTYLALRY